MASELEVDIASAVLRIEQVAALPEGDPLREHLIDRLLTCDAFRLRQYIGPEMLARMKAMKAEELPYVVEIGDGS